VPGVSTRKVKRIMQELCGSEVSSSTISHLVKGLDQEISYFSNRKLGGGNSFVFVRLFGMEGAS